MNEIYYIIKILKFNAHQRVNSVNMIEKMLNYFFN